MDNRGSSRRGQPLASLRQTVTLRRHKGDHWLMIDVLLLLVIGLVTIYSISPALADTTKVSGSYYVWHQLIAILLAGVAFFVAVKVPLGAVMQKYRWLLGAGVLATLAALALPVNPNYPAHRWVRLGGFSFQSVELVILAVLVWFARFLAMRMQEKSVDDLKKTLRPVLIALLIIGAGISIAQSDLGSTAVIVLMMVVMAFVAGMPIKRFVTVFVVILALVIVAVAAFPYRLARLETFLHPTANCQTTGYQSCQAMIAVGSGGLSGLGLGSGVQAYGYLPEADNDSIFAIFAEKFGFIGDIVLLVIYANLFYRMIKIAERAPDNFSRLLVIGIMTWLSIETLINIGAMIGLLPLKGITLPFISYGGTSVVFFAAAIGLVFQISRTTYFTDQVNNRRAISHDYSGQRRGVRGAYHPDPSGRS